MSRYNHKCDYCQTPITPEEAEEFELPLRGGSPYPEYITTCQNSACKQKGEVDSAAEWKSHADWLREEDEREEEEDDQ